MYETLEDLIERSPKHSEVKRGIAVQQDLAGKSRNSIAGILSISVKSISKWRLIYDEHGVDGLISAHQGAKPRAFLNETQKASVLAYIRSQEVFGIAELAAYLKSEYDVSYKSPQSYYNLLHEAGMSWHKSQKQNPKRDEQKVQHRRMELKKNFKKNENLSKEAKR